MLSDKLGELTGVPEISIQHSSASQALSKMPNPLQLWDVEQEGIFGVMLEVKKNANGSRVFLES